MVDLFGREVQIGDLILAKRKVRSSFVLSTISHIFAIYLGDNIGFIGLFDMMNQEMYYACELTSALIIAQPNEDELSIKETLIKEMLGYTESRGSFHMVSNYLKLIGREKCDD